MRVQTSIYKYKGFPEHYTRDFMMQKHGALFCSDWVLIGLCRPKTARTPDLESLLVLAFPFSRRDGNIALE